MNPYGSIGNPVWGEWGIMGIGDRNRSSGVPLWIETNNPGKSYM